MRLISVLVVYFLQTWSCIVHFYNVLDMIFWHEWNGLSVYHQWLDTSKVVFEYGWWVMESFLTENIFHFEMTFSKDNFIRIYQPNNSMDRAIYGLLFHKRVLIFKKKSLWCLLKISILIHNELINIFLFSNIKEKCLPNQRYFWSILLYIVHTKSKYNV